MVYKNFLYRIIFAIILFIFYLISISEEYFLLILATIIYLLIFYECLIFFKKFFYLIILYILISFLSFYIYFFIFYDFYLFNILIFVIIIFDSFSYFTGKIFGKIYIFKIISPKKSLEGYIGGVLFTNLIILSFLWLFSNEVNLVFLIFMMNAIIIFSILGDLIQSFFKRKNNIKNSSTYLPGHGGFFDRFDSFIPSIIFLLFISFFIK